MKSKKTNKPAKKLPASKVPVVAKAKKAKKVPENFVKAAKFVMQLQNTNTARENLKDAHYKEAMRLAKIADTKKNRSRLGTVIWRMRKNMKKKEDKDPTAPLVLNKELEFKIRLCTLPQDIKRMLNSIAAKMTSGITAGKMCSSITGIQKEDEEKCVKSMGLKQLIIGNDFSKLFGIKEKEKKVSKEKGLLFQMKLEKFVSDALQEMDVEFDAIDMSLLYTAKGTDVQQVPHTDYKLVAAMKEDIRKKHKLAWTLHLPLTKSGSWITLWNGHGYGTNVHIEFGKCLFLRSDVVHAGGKPDLGSKTNDHFLRLHAYLPTKFQAVDRSKIYLTDYSGQSLKDVYILHAV